MKWGQLCLTTSVDPFVLTGVSLYDVRSGVAAIFVSEIVAPDSSFNKQGYVLDAYLFPVPPKSISSPCHQRLK